MGWGPGDGSNIFYSPDNFSRKGLPMLKIGLVGLYPSNELWMLRTYATRFDSANRFDVLLGIVARDGINTPPSVISELRKMVGLE